MVNIHTSSLKVKKVTKIPDIGNHQQLCNYAISSVPDPQNNHPRSISYVSSKLMLQNVFEKQRCVQLALLLLVVNFCCDREM